jgi:hypothetical protein
VKLNTTVSLSQAVIVALFPDNGGNTLMAIVCGNETHPFASWAITE